SDISGKYRNWITASTVGGELGDTQRPASARGIEVRSNQPGDDRGLQSPGKPQTPAAEEMPNRGVILHADTVDPAPIGANPYAGVSTMPLSRSVDTSGPGLTAARQAATEPRLATEGVIKSPIHPTGRPRESDGSGQATEIPEFPLARERRE